MGNEEILALLSNINGEGGASAGDLRGLQAESYKALLQPAQPSLMETLGQALGAALPLAFADGSEARGLAAPGAAKGFLQGQQDIKNRIDKKLNRQLLVGKMAGEQAGAIEGRADKRVQAQLKFSTDIAKRKIFNQLDTEEKLRRLKLGLPAGGVTVQVGGRDEFIKFSPDTIKTAAQSDGVIATSMELVRELEKIEDPRFVFKFKGEHLKSTETGRVFAKLDELATALTKINQGSRPSDLDMAIFMGMVKGSVEVNAQDVKKLVTQVTGLMAKRRNAALLVEAGLKNRQTQSDILSRARAGEQFLIPENAPQEQGPVKLLDWTFRLPSGKTVKRSQLLSLGKKESEIVKLIESGQISIVSGGE